MPKNQTKAIQAAVEVAVAKTEVKPKTASEEKKDADSFKPRFSDSLFDTKSVV